MATYVSAKAALAELESAGGPDPVEDLRAGWDLQIEFGIANPTLFTLLSAPGRGQQSPAVKVVNGRETAVADRPVRVLPFRMYRQSRHDDQRCW